MVEQPPFTGAFEFWALALTGVRNGRRNDTRGARALQRQKPALLILSFLLAELKPCSTQTELTLGTIPGHLYVPGYTGLLSAMSGGHTL